jgi:outer membrane lipoprotein-sorting protein
MDMKTRRMIALVTTASLLTATSFGDNITPNDILKRVDATYKSMQTYKAEGTITSDIDTGGMKMNMVTSFSILLKKPNLYLISWTQKNMPMPGMVQSGAVWSDGTQPYLYMGMMNAYSKITTDEMALGSATGISGGAAFTIRHYSCQYSRSKPLPCPG